MIGPTTTKQPTRAAEVVEVARIVAAAGLVEAFGHISARIPGGFMITTTRPFSGTDQTEVLEVGPDGRPIADEAPADLPLEAPLHAAVYAARDDVNAICRTHSPAAVRAGARVTVPPLVHGLGGLAGEVALCGRIDLVTDREAGEQIAVALGGADCLLIRGNGSIAVASSLADAAVRAHYLEERCLVGEGLKPDRALDDEEIATRSQWFEKERVRAWAWMQWRYGG